MKQRKSSVLLASTMLMGLLSYGVASAAAAQPVSLKASGHAVQIVKSIYSNYLAENPKVQIKASTIVPWAGHPAQIVAKFISPSTCRDNGKRCHTVVLGKNQSGNWGIMLQQSVASISIAPHPQQAPADIILDGVHVWEPLGDHYLPVINSYLSGQPMTANHPVKNKITKHILSSFFHGGSSFAQQTVNVGGSLGAIDVVQPTGNDCGLAGCDMIVFGDHHPVIDTISPGLFGIAKRQYTRDGVRGIVIGTYSGLDFYEWDGARAVFQKVRTTYPSRTSPSP
jgi:hypothetical protein